MNSITYLRRTLVAAGAGIALLLALSGNAVAQFNEQFNSPTLDPEWQVFTFTGARVYGYTSPANHYSLTDNPGYLRYYLDPMTHHDGFAYNYQTSYEVHSCCNHDPGLDLCRTITGEEWLLEAKADYYLPPYANGRAFALDVYFGDGSTGTFSVQFQRWRDVNQNGFRIMLAEKTTANPWDYPLLEDEIISYELYGSANSTLYFKLERSGGELKAMWSEDGSVWNTAFSHDMGTQLDGLAQTVVVTGISWFVPAGSYADWDYITVTPTSITVDIDIKPGSDPNSINPNSKGVIPVAILTTHDFDATTVDPLSVKFGPGEATESHNKGHIEDIDGDGDYDLVLHFTTEETGIKRGDTEATLSGKTYDGKNITGTAAIKTVGRG